MRDKQSIYNNQSSEGFYFSDGSVAIDLEEFLFKLKRISDAEYNSHISLGKNDFANWVGNTLKKYGLANLILNANSKSECVQILETYLYEKAPTKQKQEEEPATTIEPEAEKAPAHEHLEHMQKKIQETIQNRYQNQEEEQQQENQKSVPKPVESKHTYHSPILKKEIDKELSVLRSQRFTNTKTEEKDQDLFKRPEQEQNVPPAIHHKTIGSSSHDQIIKQEQKEEAVLQTTILNEEDAEEIAGKFRLAKDEIQKVMKGQQETIHYVFISLLCEAHSLLEGVPGLAKSLLVECLSKVMAGTSFRRIQFMPDILPADVIGSQIYNPQKNEFVTIKGPIFANFVLADEINRAPPKTHSALMEAMAEKKINIDKEEFILERPFLVLATQNPLENKGTYQLPEAVLDRFLFKLILDYPGRDDEKEIIIRNATTNTGIKHTIQPVLTKEYLKNAQKKVKSVYVSERIKDYIMDIVEATRGKNKGIIGMKFINYGGGPRASISLGIASRAQALLNGRNYVLPEDVRNIALSVLRHRLALNFKGKAHNVSTDKVIQEILTKVTGL